jgi:hypothetical protein
MQLRLVARLECTGQLAQLSFRGLGTLSKQQSMYQNSGGSLGLAPQYPFLSSSSSVGGTAVDRSQSERYEAPLDKSTSHISPTSRGTNEMPEMSHFSPKTDQRRGPTHTRRMWVGPLWTGLTGDQSRPIREARGPSGQNYKSHFTQNQGGQTRCRNVTLFTKNRPADWSRGVQATREKSLRYSQSWKMYSCCLFVRL